MTHEEKHLVLLENIDNQEFAYDNLAQALMSVVALHKPKDKNCAGCSEIHSHLWIAYPCSTIQAIEKGLK